MTTNTNPRIYPGLNDSFVEFFNHNNQVKAFVNGKMLDLKEVPFSYHQIIKEALNDLPEAKKVLKEWFPKSETHQLQKFIECRFGGLDFTPDIEDYKLQPGEYWDCPLRGNCKGEGKVCQPLIYNNNPLSFKEIKLLKLLITNDTNELIGDKLNVPMGSLHKMKRILYAKLGIQTKQGAAEVVRSLNLA
ncbi:helix-turn-helix transcriptional regulator [Lacinutrix iliipiscaria]|uniref:Helix-turn-helix transcriptional regulator n=1 Tax=Lacinutrix iliipiscaria TaxID=1230532 RepID=A0ABW5WT40_9FLAO